MTDNPDDPATPDLSANQPHPIDTRPDERSIRPAAAAVTRENQMLGLDTNELASLTVDELLNNPTAIKMMLHYYKHLNDQNVALKNDLNTAETYVESYGNKKNNGVIAAALLLLSSISTGFGINLLTSGDIAPGIITFVPGIFLAIAGLYFSFKES